jgi:hypothetical protein
MTQTAAKPVTDGRESALALLKSDHQEAKVMLRLCCASPY